MWDGEGRANKVVFYQGCLEVGRGDPNAIRQRQQLSGRSRAPDAPQLS